MSNGNVWLTGGGTGIGKDLTKILCDDDGFDVIISGRRKDKLLKSQDTTKRRYFHINLM